MTLDSMDKQISGSIEFCEYYAHLHKPSGPESGELTPISCGSEYDFNTNDATAGSSSAPEYDTTVTEEMDQDGDAIDNNETLTHESFKQLKNDLRASMFANNLNSSSSNTPRVISPLSSNINICTNDLTNYNLKPVENILRDNILKDPSTSKIDIKNFIKDFGIEKDLPNSNYKNISNTSYSKWNTNKEKFLEPRESKTDNIDFGKNLNTGMSSKMEKEKELLPGAILVKESYIDPPKINRISKSFHGQSTTSSSFLDISATPRRASDSEHLTGCKPESQLFPAKTKKSNETKTRPQFVSQMSQPCDDSLKWSSRLPRKTSLSAEGASRHPRFTTTRVDEADHAASVSRVWPTNTTVKPSSTIVRPSSSGSQENDLSEHHTDENLDSSK